MGALIMTSIEFTETSFWLLRVSNPRPEHRWRPVLGHEVFTVQSYETDFVVQIRIQIFTNLELRSKNTNTKGNEENFVYYEGNFVFLFFNYWDRMKIRKIMVTHKPKLNWPKFSLFSNIRRITSTTFFYKGSQFLWIFT